MPLPFGMILFCYSYFTKHIKRKRLSFWLALIILFASSNGWFVNQCLSRWEVNMPTPKQPYDIAVVLTGGMSIVGPDSLHHARISADRFMQPLLLYKRGIVNKILISGGTTESPLLKNDVVQEAESTISLLKNLGVKSEDIIWESRSRNTYENAKFSAAILKQTYPNARILLCTSAFHLRRAKACFDKQGLKTTMLSTDFRSEPAILSVEMLLMPKEEYLHGFQMLIRELIGYGVYKAMGYC
jgi:uncharacterized SAM-binding protein YcdF (DUF218 family)